MSNIKDKSICYGCRCETCRWRAAAKRIRLMDAFDRLSDREKKVLIMLDGLDGTPQSMDAVGREFGVTRERIRQLADRAHAKLAYAISDDSVVDLLRECAREIMVSRAEWGTEKHESSGSLRRIAGGL